MSQLQTYAHVSTEDYPIGIVRHSSCESDGPWRPGDILVCMDRNIGVVITNNDKNITILWSRPRSDGFAFDPNDFSQRKGILTYATSKVRQDYYGTVNILDIPEEDK